MILVGQAHRRPSSHIDLIGMCGGERWALNDGEAGRIGQRLGRGQTHGHGLQLLLQVVLVLKQVLDGLHVLETGLWGRGKRHGQGQGQGLVLVWGRCRRRGRRRLQLQDLLLVLLLGELVTLLLNPLEQPLDLAIVGALLYGFGQVL